MIYFLLLIRISRKYWKTCLLYTHCTMFNVFIQSHHSVLSVAKGEIVNIEGLFSFYNYSRYSHLIFYREVYYDREVRTEILLKRLIRFVCYLNSAH